MDFKAIFEKHPKRFVLAIPSERDNRGFVVKWKVLNSVPQFDEAKKLYEFYCAEKFAGIVIISTYENSDVDEASANARMMRVYLGMELQ